MGRLLQEEGVARDYRHRGQLGGLLGWLVHDVDDLVENLNLVLREAKVMWNPHFLQRIDRGRLPIRILLAILSLNRGEYDHTLRELKLKEFLPPQEKLIAVCALAFQVVSVKQRISLDIFELLYLLGNDTVLD